MNQHILSPADILFIRSMEHAIMLASGPTIDEKYKRLYIHIEDEVIHYTVYIHGRPEKEFAGENALDKAVEYYNSL